MSKTVDVTIPIDAEAAKALENPARREAIGRYLSGLLKGGRVRGVSGEAIDADIEVQQAEAPQASRGKQMMGMLGRHLTYRVDLPGGQLRLREMILHVSEHCSSAQHFDRTKLNKIIWKADFDAFAARRVPVTGRPYQRLQFGPVPVEMPPLYGEMLQEGVIHLDRIDHGDGSVEHRTIADVRPELKLFSQDDLSYVDAAIAHYWNKTGNETSDNSFGVAWATRENGDPMPYELALLSDRCLGKMQAERLLEMARQAGWNSR
jgi:Antitoxin SocA-like, Panacea domain